jgi:ATP-binding cassette subfamily B multidrug efflux pump
MLKRIYVSYRTGQGPRKAVKRKEPRLPLMHTLRHFRTIQGYFVENRWGLIIGLACLLLVDFMQLVIPLVIKQAIDLLTRRTAVPAVLLREGLVIVGIALAMGIFRYVWRHLIFGHSRRVEQRLRNRLYEHLQTLSPSFYQNTKTGDLMARAINDIDAIRMATGMGLVAMTDGTVLGLAAVGFMLSISPKLTAICLIPAPVIVIFTRILTRRMSTGFERVQKTFSDVTERVREAFAATRVVKAYQREEWEYDRVKAEGERYISNNLSLARTLALFFPMMTIFTNLGLAVVIWMGGRLTILGEITTGDFVAFTSYLNLLTWPMMAMGWVTNLVQRGSASMRRINSILQEVPETRAPPRSLSAPRIHGEIEVRGLTFRYPDKTSFQLKDIRLHVAAGETLALVGRVGCGKTTLLKAMVRLIETPPGALFLDGHDIRGLSLNYLRQSVGFVTQEVFLFSDTIRDNLLLGREGITDEAVETALKISAIEEKVASLDGGLGTFLGERGITLSGGQRQRLTVARALISDPPVLILDDAFSMVDTRTEEGMLDRILDLRKEKTNIIVSHRASTLARTDRIIVLANGGIVEQGHHRALLKKGGIYTRLYEERRLAEELKVL